MAATRTLPTSTVDLHLTEIPNAVLGFFGIRTETELPFDVLLQDGDFSIRNYPPHSELRNEEVGTRKEAVNRSFGRLFSYLHGENWDATRFAMTTPVILRSRGPSRWSTSFYLKDAVEDLPLPKSSAVKLYAVTARTMAVLRFSGRLTETSLRLHADELREWIARRDLKVIGEPEVAQFDQPFSIPFLRRNEVHIPIETL